MKVLIGSLTLFVFVAGAVPSDALPFFKKRRCLPKAIDSPVVRQSVKEGHKAGNHLKHPGDC